MTNTSWVITAAGGSRVVNLYKDGTPYITNESNPNYNAIIERLDEEDYEGIEALFNAEETVRRKFEELTDRISVSNGHVYFDGDLIENDLSDHLLRVISEHGDVRPVAAFWERIAANPTEHSRENLLRWLRATEGFTITDDGLIVAYKGLTENLTSIHAGPGIVNGEECNGHLDNSVGNVVTMARSQVEHNPSQGCSFGLHVGTWGYASSFGRRVVEVLVDPRDVVSVPTDCDGQKMRVCRYRVVEEVWAGRDTAVVDNELYDVDDDFEESEFSVWKPFS